MANDVIHELRMCPLIEQITLVGTDHLEVTQFIDVHINSFIPKEPLGINRDVTSALKDESKIAILLPDLPALKHQEISLALELADQSPTSFIRDFEGSGTTFYACRDREKFLPNFGAQSAQKHLSTGAIEITDKLFMGIRRDCDSWADIVAIHRGLLGSSTQSVVEQQMHN